MKIAALSALALGLVLELLSPVLADDAVLKRAETKRATRLYNGRDLAGWVVRDGQLESWQANGPLLSCVASKGGWLLTEAAYSDFVLRLEYRLPAAGNSGVGLRIPSEGRASHAGMEIQLLDDDHEKFAAIRPAQHTGSIYYQVAAKRGAAKPPGEWNAMEIACRGPRITIRLNGTKIIDADVDQHLTAEGAYAPLAERPQIGQIGLQSHGTQVDFRRISLVDLTQPLPEGGRYFEITRGAADGDAAGPVQYRVRRVDGSVVASGEAESVESLPAESAAWRHGLHGMRPGSRRKLIVPAPEAEAPGVVVVDVSLAAPPE